MVCFRHGSHVGESVSLRWDQVNLDEALLADSTPPTCASPASSSSFPFIILDNQTYALCAATSCFVFNEVACCKCNVKTGDSISLALKYDDGKDVCTVNEEGVNNGYMVSTFSVPGFGS
jgi:hypothetical protein